MSRLVKFVIGIDRTNQIIGRGVAWCALAMVILQFTVVVLRYTFGIGAIWLQESVIYTHSILFLVGAGYTLLVGGHVRVDIFYREASERQKVWIDLIGSIFLLLPVCGLILITSFPYVSASWKIFEHSIESSGIHAIYILKSLLLVFGGLLVLQGVSIILRSVLVLAGVQIASVEVKNAE